MLELLSPLGRTTHGRIQRSPQCLSTRLSCTASDLLAAAERNGSRSRALVGVGRRRALSRLCGRRWRPRRSSQDLGHRSDEDIVGAGGLWPVGDVRGWMASTRHAGPSSCILAGRSLCSAPSSASPEAPATGAVSWMAGGPHGGPALGPVASSPAVASAPAASSASPKASAIGAISRGWPRSPWPRSRYRVSIYREKI